MYQPIEKLKQESMKAISKYSNATKIYMDGSVNKEKLGMGIYIMKDFKHQPDYLITYPYSQQKLMLS